jgi:tetratricopeptide (TPR) repeat protein
VAVLIFAFLAASFAVRNSDFWQHLAAGRLLAQGAYRFGEDPFACTTAGVYWANHAWLFDLTLYAAYQLAGGAALVVLKALAVAALAALLLAIRRPGIGPGVPALCTTLAVLVMSPRLLLQPACASCLLLGGTLWLLWRPTARPGRWERWRLAALLVLFALWANVDGWFLLGPLLAGLFWLGDRLEGGPRHLPGWLVPAGLAVCLVNPHHGHVFTLPAEVAPAVWASGLPQETYFRPLFLSPWQLPTYLQPTAGLSAAGLAYFVLTALGLLSFALHPAGLRDWRLPVWVVFAGLGAWQVRLVPFFAVVAGPVTTLNLQDWLIRRRPASQRGAAVAPSVATRVGQAALLLVILSLAVLTWPGWLQAVPHERHRVAWEVRVEPSLRRLAQTLTRWRDEGLLADGDHVFAPHPDVAHYCAWFAPREKGFLDHRLPLFVTVAAPYRAALRALEGKPDEEGRQVLQTFGVRAAVLYDGDWLRLLAGVHALAQDPRRWTLCRIDGRAVVFLRRGGRAAPAPPALDPEGLAFGSTDNSEMLPRIPNEWGASAPRPRSDWERFARPAPPVAWESDATGVYLFYFEELAARRQRQPISAVLGPYESAVLGRYAAALVGLAGVPDVPAGAATRVLLPLLRARDFLPDLVNPPPALPLLAIRAARRALAANPDDAAAWLRLGQAYRELHQLTGERSPRHPWPLLEALRHVQIAAALEHALTLEPDLEPAHRALADLFLERGFLDAALVHRREALRLARRRASATDPQEVDPRLAQEEERVGALEERVANNTNDYTLQSRPLAGDPLLRARLALRLGLARLAVDDVLLRSPGQLLRGEGTQLLLQLLLMLGRPEEARVALEDESMQENKPVLGETDIPFYRLPAYEWLRLCQCAAEGDYAGAAEAAGLMRRAVHSADQQGPARLRKELPVVLATEAGLGALPPSPLPWRVVRLVREDMRRSAAAAGVFLHQEQADLRTLEGLLALEQGDAAAAVDSFLQALRSGGNEPFAGRALATAYLGRLAAAGSAPRR